MQTDYSKTYRKVAAELDRCLDAEQCFVALYTEAIHLQRAVNRLRYLMPPLKEGQPPCSTTITFTRRVGDKLFDKLYSALDMSSAWLTTIEKRCPNAWMYTEAERDHFTQLDARVRLLFS